MTTQIEAARSLKPRNVKPEAGQQVCIKWSNGVTVTLDETMFVLTAKAKAKPAKQAKPDTTIEPVVVQEKPEATPEATPEAEAEVKPVRRGGKRKAKQDAPAKNERAKESARKNAGQSTWAEQVIQEDKFKGLAVFKTKKGLADVALLGIGDKAYRLGFLMETKKGTAYVWKKSCFFIKLNDERLTNVELF